MPCVAVPVPSLPSLPAPFTLGATQPPQISFAPGLCCKILPTPIATPPVPLPPQILNPAFISAINAGTQQVIAFIRTLSISCPRN